MFNYFFNLLFRNNEFTEVRQDLLHFDSIMNLIHYESISVTWANLISKYVSSASEWVTFEKQKFVNVLCEVGIWYQWVIQCNTDAAVSTYLMFLSKRLSNIFQFTKNELRLGLIFYLKSFSRTIFKPVLFSNLVNSRISCVPIYIVISEFF